MSKEDEDQEVIIDASQRDRLIKTLHKSGVNLLSLDWIELGRKLHLDESILLEAKEYFDVLKDLFQILHEDDRSGVGSGVGICLSIWLRSAKRPTLQSLTNALTEMGEGGAIDRINGSYFLKKALNENHTIRTRWTTMSVSGPPKSGKSCFLKLLRDEPQLLQFYISLRRERTSYEPILKTSSLMMTREIFTLPWKMLNYSLLKDMITSEIKSSAVPLPEAYLRSHTSTRPASLELDLKVRSLLQRCTHKLAYALETRRKKLHIEEKLELKRFYDQRYNLGEHLEKLDLLKDEKMIKLLDKQQVLRQIREYLCDLLRMCTSHRPPLIKTTTTTSSAPPIPPPIPRLKPMYHHAPPPPLIDHTHSARIQSSLSSNTSSSFDYDIIEDILDALPNVSLSPNLSQAHFIHVVDARGDPAFRDIIPALFHYNTVNVITHQLDKELTQCSRNDHLSPLEIIESTVHSLAFVQPPLLEGTLSQAKPNFLVLGTYYDQMQRSGASEAEVKEDLNDTNYHIKTKLEDFRELILRYGSSLVFPINATSREDDDHTFKVSKAIRRKVSKCYIEADIPLSWFIFQRIICQCQVNTPVIDKSELVEFGDKLKMSPEDVQSALMHFHDLSIILYFPKVLGSVVFLDPQFFWEGLTNLAQDGSGVLSLDDLGRVSDHFSVSVVSFLQLLENLLLVTPIPDDDRFLFPCCLPRVSREDIYLRTFKGEVPLVLKWETGPVPQGLFPALVVCLIQQDYVVMETPYQYRNAIKFLHRFSGENILLIDSFYWIEILCTAEDRPQLYLEIKDTVFSCIDKVVKTFNYSPLLLTPKEHFLCLKHGDTADPSHPSRRHLATIHESQQMVTCSVDGTSYLIDYKRQLPWLKRKIRQQPKNNFIKDMDTVSTLLKEGSFRFRKWLKLGLALGLDKSTLTSIQHDSTNKCLEECLAIWERKTGNPKWLDLVTALREIEEVAAADHIDKQL